MTAIGQRYAMSGVGAIIYAYSRSGTMAYIFAKQKS